MNNPITNIYTIEAVKTTLAVENSAKRKKLYQINFLRVVASISVCLFHLACGNPNLLGKGNFLYQLLDYNYLRNQVFFVVSGFIICYTMPQNYELKNFGPFFKKRLIRLEPPYLVSILLCLLVAYIASFITHNPVEISWKNLLYHIGYINNFTTNTYINVVYWTLGIEFQFYILIGLLFPLINKSVYFLTAFILILLLSHYIRIDHTSLIFEQTPLFCIGILMYFICYNYKYPKPILIGLLAVTLLVHTLNRPENLFVSLFTICIILVPFGNNKLVAFLSKISYSLYLTHVPIGGRIINLSLRFVKTDFEKYLAITAAFAVSILVAYLFYLAIEKPAIKWSKQMRYSGVK